MQSDFLSHFNSLFNHSMREPLRNMANFSYLLGQRAETLNHNDIFEYSQHIQELVQHMDAVLQTLHAYITISPASHCISPIILDDIFDRVLATLQESWPDLMAHLCVGELPVVQGNEGYLFTLFNVLLRHVSESFSSPRGQVVIWSSQHPKGSKVFISNNGHLPDESAPQKKNYLSSHTHNKPPHHIGMDLLLAARIMEIHQGALQTLSHGNKGTLVVLTFPAIKADKDAH